MMIRRGDQIGCESLWWNGTYQMLNENLKLELKVRDQVTQLHIFRSLKPAYHLSTGTGPKYDAHSLGKSLDVSHPRYRYRYPESELRCMSHTVASHDPTYSSAERLSHRPVLEKTGQ